MGMFTEIYVNVDLKEDTPTTVIKTLKAMCERNKDFIEKQGFPARWTWLFNDGSFYTPKTSVANLTFNKSCNQWSLLGKGDIKNYEQEIEEFFDWIKPYVDAEGYDELFIGYYRYEREAMPTLVSVKGETK